MDGCQLTCELFDSMLWCSRGNGRLCEDRIPPSPESAAHCRETVIDAVQYISAFGCSCLRHRDMKVPAALARWLQCDFGAWYKINGNKLLSVFTSLIPKGQGNAAVRRLNLSSHEFLVFVGASSHLLLLWSWGVMVNRDLMPAGEYTDALAFI